MTTQLKHYAGLWAEAEPQFDALLAEDLTPESAHDWLRRWSDLARVVSEADNAAARAASENTADPDREEAHLKFIQEIAPRVDIAEQALKEKLLAVDGFVPNSGERHLLKRLRSEADLFRAENVPLDVEIETLVAEYDKIVGAMTVERNGETQTLQQADQALEDPDRETREGAWRAIQSRWLADRTALDDLFLGLRTLRQRVAAGAGRANYRDYRWEELQRFDYTPEDGRTFAEAIEEHFVPLALRRRERRRLQLGLNSLRPWDLEVDPLSRQPLKPFQTAAQLEATVARLLAQLDPALGAEFAQLRPAFLDLESRRNKAPGGYCTFFPQSGLPYIFMNAVGTHSDVQTLLHEAGHAFHDLASHSHQPLVWNVGAPAEFAEVASMGMELLASGHLEESRGGFYTESDAARARSEHLEGIVQFLPYMAVVDQFQQWVYADAPESVTAADMDRHWQSLWQRFLPGVDWSGLESEQETGWHRKMHIYQYPFYYIEYGIAQLGALQVWRNSLTDQPGALRAYREALALGNTRPLPDLFAAAGARFAFDSQTVGELAALVASHLAE